MIDLLVNHKDIQISSLCMGYKTTYNCAHMCQVKGQLYPEFLSAVEIIEMLKRHQIKIPEHFEEYI